MLNSATTSERLFTAGNERTRLFYNTASDPNLGSGYHLRKDDEFKFIMELMNTNMEDKVSSVKEILLLQSQGPELIMASTKLV